MKLFIRLFLVICLFINTLNLHAQEISCSFHPEQFSISVGDLRAYEWTTEHLSVGSEPGFRHELKKRQTNTPWVAIAAVPVAAGGWAAHFRTRSLHKDYMQSSETDEAVKLRKEVKQMQLIRNVSFGVAGLLGVTGIIFYRKEFRNNKRVRIEYLPFACGGSIGLTF